MGLERDQRIFEGLLRKSQDTGLPLAERKAFHAKAEEIYRRMQAQKPAPGAAKPKAKAKANANAKAAKPAAKAQPSRKTKPEPASEPPKAAAKKSRAARVPLSWRPLQAVAACAAGIAAGLALQTYPQTAMVVLPLGLAAAFLVVARSRRLATVAATSEAAG